MKLSRTTIQVYREGERFVRPSGMRAGASLHSHSECSRERLDFVPGIAHRMPLVGLLFERSVAKLNRELGRPLDFDSVYWRPPATPAAVIASERGQIERRFECQALVALTDHDTLEGPRSLRTMGAIDTPLSVEWSVNVEETVLHLGVHGIAPDRLEEAERALAASLEGRPDRTLGELLAWLTECPETFIVLNHPFWDYAGVGSLRHESILLSFLRAHRHRIHALELNGYRRWSENRRVLPLAEGFALPVIAGGDRHGHTPNAMINLTGATCFAELAHDLRAGRPTWCVVLPEYSEPFAARVFQGVRDALWHDPSHRRSRFGWGERVFFTANGAERSMSSMWPRGGPWWMKTAVAVTSLLGSPSVRPLLRLALSGEHSAL